MMLLLYQVGSVKIGEVVRYTVSYTPSNDRILPSPEFLYLRIRNTSTIALRAAFVHGPYTLSVSAYPSAFNPNETFQDPRRYGVPEFEPMLKASGTWNCHLVVPDSIRQTAGEGSSKNGRIGNEPDHEGERVSWIIEVTSQVMFSTTAAVHYEVILARDEKSLNIGSVVPVIGNQTQVPEPGRVTDFQPSSGAHNDHRDHGMHARGVFSRAIHVRVEDTAALWKKPEIPGWHEVGWLRGRAADSHDSGKVDPDPGIPRRPTSTKQKPVHLVLLTHGLHSNLGGDMLFMKESIDAAARQAKLDAKARRREEKAKQRESDPDKYTATKYDTADIEGGKCAEEEDDNEDVVVRGFSENATKTERGIKYLGKRLARYVLSMTYPDQPFLPTTRAASDAIVHTLKITQHNKQADGKSAQRNNSINTTFAEDQNNRRYRITKISFIGHSLGGLVQTYAVAYIQKHSPQFFTLIEPVNFIALATPFLGLNHENPLYVKAALDFGLVGRTGQDLGLTWRAPTIARSGWGALVGNLGDNAHKRGSGDTQADSKPLLRILPTGPAHTALKKFRNRTVYSNVVNDGIVPLRTSCLLFLDWQGLGRVKKARRGVGLVETVVGFGWAELTGTNVTSPRLAPWSPFGAGESPSPVTPSPKGVHDCHQVPQPSANAILEDDRESTRYREPGPKAEEAEAVNSHTMFSTNNSNPFTGLFNFFRSSDSPRSKSPIPSPKQNRIYQRSQTLRFDDPSVTSSASSSKSKVTTGPEPGSDEGVSAPPKTSIFESAGDLLNPKLPSVEYLIDPSKRPRTIFHDRIYHPADIPPPSLKRRTTPGPTGSLAIRRKSQANGGSSNSHKTDGSDRSLPFPSTNTLHEDTGLSQPDCDNTAHTYLEQGADEVIGGSQMRVEEKIARAYHRDMSWRKVLVKLEPDAHNNIIVRRMFDNAFGWPVVHHLVEAHFSDSAAARTRNEDEGNAERAKNPADPPGSNGQETKPDSQLGAFTMSGKDTAVGPTIRLDPSHKRTTSEAREALDAVPDLPTAQTGLTKEVSHMVSPILTASDKPIYPHVDRVDSITWSDRDWLDSEDDTDGSRRGSESGNPSTNRFNAADRSARRLACNWTEKGAGREVSSSVPAVCAEEAMRKG